MECCTDLERPEQQETERAALDADCGPLKTTERLTGAGDKSTRPLFGCDKRSFWHQLLVVEAQVQPA